MTAKEAERQLMLVKKELDEQLREMRNDHQRQMLDLTREYQPYFDFYLDIINGRQNQTVS